MHKVTAVVFDPQRAEHPDPRVSSTATELYEFEVSTWYEALDRLTSEIQRRHSSLVRVLGMDHYIVKAISMVHEPD